MIPYAVQRIDHLVIRVVDLERSITFYGRVLGMTVVRRRDDLGLVHLRAGVSMIDLISVDGQLGREGGSAAATAARNVDHYCLRVDPFDATTIMAHLDTLKVPHSAKAYVNLGAEGEGLSIYLTDPDGNKVELKGPVVESVIIAT